MKRLLLSLAALCVATTGSAQDWAKPRLEKSPRHSEYIKVKNGDRTVTAFISFPEVKTKATAIIVIHDNQGLTDWARGVGDQFSEAGYIAIVPDLLSGMAPGGGGTAEMPNRDAVAKGFTELGQRPDQVTGDLNAIHAYVAKLPASNGKVVVGGFCWGGAQTFRYATNNKDIKAALVFYGGAPADADLPKIAAPVHAFYAGNDARINAAVPKVQELMKAAGKSYDVVYYDGSGHGFMKAGEGPPPSLTDEQKKDAEVAKKATDGYSANQKARTESWKRVKEILAKI
jgi:carboxymethylenebutenolidase